MNSKFSLKSISLKSLVLSAALVLGLVSFAGVASAQGGPDIFVTPIPNAPFSAMITVERSIVQRNGGLMNLKTIREIGRDNQGRVHNEARMLMPQSDGKTPAIVSIHLYDPVSRTTAYLNPQQKTYTTGVVNHPPATEPPNAYASPSGNSLPLSQFARQEDLGTRDIEGQQAHGVRITQTIPAESSGMGREVVTVDEYWYSDDLHINLEMKHSDPRTGSVTMTVSQVNRAEPDASFFEVPPDYKPAAPRQ